MSEEAKRLAEQRSGDLLRVICELRASQDARSKVGKTRFYTAKEITMIAFSATKDRQALAGLLLSIEHRFNVNNIKIDGVHLWPLARIAIGSVFKEQEDGTAIQTLGAEAPAAELPLDGFPRNNSERVALRNHHRLLMRRKSLEELRKLAESAVASAGKLQGVDFIILAKVEKYHEKVGEHRYAPVLDPVFEDMQLRGRAAVLGLEPIPFACVHEPHRIDAEPYLLTTAFHRTLARRVLQPKAFKVAGYRLRRLNDFIRREEPQYCFDVDAVLRRYRMISHWSGFFARIFAAIRPKCILLSSFTGWLHAVLAARTLGIPTIDVQHGGQARFHHPTTHLSRLPKRGYDIMPDVFWLWGEANREYTAQWLPGRARRHIPVVGGNRQVARWYKRVEAKELEFADRSYIDQFGGRPVVLVTLSYGIEPLLPEPLIAVMSRVSHVDWHVRMHPTHRSEGVAKEIRQRLESRGCRKLFIEEPTEVQLPTALSVSLAHITPFSTAGVEAISMGVPTLIATRVGARLFEDDLNAGIVAFADDADAIENWLRSVASAGRADEGRRRLYVETSDEAVDRVLQVAFSIKRRPSMWRRLMG